MRRLLRAPVVNRRIEHHLVLRAELRLKLALEDVLEYSWPTGPPRHGTT